MVFKYSFTGLFSATDTVDLKQINGSGIPTLMKIHNHERYVNISLYNPRMMVLAWHSIGLDN